MTKKKKNRDEPPAKSNRGRPDARGVFIVFEQEERVDAEQQADADQALVRDNGDDDDRA